MKIIIFFRGFWNLLIDVLLDIDWMPQARGCERLPQTHFMHDILIWCNRLEGASTGSSYCPRAFWAVNIAQAFKLSRVGYKWGEHIGPGVKALFANHFSEPVTLRLPGTE